MRAVVQRATSRREAPACETCEEEPPSFHALVRFEARGSLPPACACAPAFVSVKRRSPPCT
eukprot:366551-Chlamydomonas_euryale.AAC.8